MRAGKHKEVQKPLTHSVYESRMLTKIAEETGVATQMGNQGNSGEGIRLICEWIWNDEIGSYEVMHGPMTYLASRINASDGDSITTSTLDWNTL